MSLKLKTFGPGNRRWNGSAAMGNPAGQFNGCRAASNFRNQLTAYLRLIGNTVAWYQPGVGVTGTLNASAWANQLGAAGSLEQATGGAQPIYLPFAGKKYFSLPAVAANNLSTPDSAVLDIPSIFTIIARTSSNDWATNSVIAAKANAAGQFSYGFVYIVTGVFTAYASFDGTTLNISTNSAAHGLTAGTIYWLATIIDAAAGTAKFYKATDTGDNDTLPSSWTQIGSTTTGLSTGTIFPSTSLLYVGRDLAATSFNGRPGRVLVYNGVAPTFSGAGTLVADANADDWSETSTNGATQVSSTTGETWTLNNTGALPAQIVGSPQLLFDGTADFMQVAMSATDFSIYKVIKPITWTDTDALFNTVNGAAVGVYQSTLTPDIRWQSTGNGTVNSGLTLNAWHILTAAKSGTTFTVSVDGAAAVSDTLTDAALDRYTIGAIDSGLGQWSNHQEKEDLIRNVADSATTQATIREYLKWIHHTP